MKPSLRLVILVLLAPAAAVAAPDYQQTVLESIFPAGGSRGSTVRVQFVGSKGSLQGADAVLVDGPGGITVSEVTSSDKGIVEATFTIAADAVPGRRMVRVKGGQTGLTNFRWFFVGPLPEHIEGKDNNTIATAESVDLPLVINGRVNPVLDQDCFRFQAKAGQNVVVAVMSHWLDAIGYDRTNMGYADLSVEVLDADGRIIAQAGDSLGYDPLVHFDVPADGQYIARVSGMGYKGFPQAIYRMTVGEIPYPTALFPPGGRRGETVDVEFFGPNIAPGTRAKIRVADDPFAIQYVSLPGEFAGVHELPLFRDDLPQASPKRGLQGRDNAFEIDIASPVTINGRFDSAGDDDWYWLKLEKGQAVTLEIMAQRHLRSPVDTLIEIFDAAGKAVAQNDDGALFGGECTHDFVPFDSRIEFAPKAAGEYFVRVSEQSGSFGKRAVYRLSVYKTAPNFRIFQWPDAVPIWGSGSSTAFVIETHRLGGFKEDVELTVEGLPAGWTGSTVRSQIHEYRVPVRAAGQKSLLTITAPKEALPGTVVNFRVVGRSRVVGREITRTAQSLTLYMWQEPNHFRISPLARAVVAPPQAFRLVSETDAITAKPGDKINVPIRVEPTGDKMPAKLSVSINRGQARFVCTDGAQIPLTGAGPTYMVPFTIPAKLKPGTYGITIADAWSSETRKGLPGPCTRLIRLTIPE